MAVTNNLVRVELISNPNVKRTMTETSLRTNAHKWRLVEGQSQVSEPVTKKKEDAGNAGQPVNPAAPVKAPVVVDPELEQLRADYLAKTGKPADKRWKADKLKTLLA